MGEFVPGIELSGAFYEDVVTGLVADVPHGAALLGTGSDVLGFDTARSTDHHWGPRLQVFVAASQVEDVRSTIGRGLPDEFQGWPTRYGWDDVPVTHHVEVATLGEWLFERVGFDPREGVNTLQWLTTPQQILLEVTSGAVVTTRTASSKPFERHSPGTRTRGGFGSSLVSGGGSTRRSRSSVEQPRSGTSSDRASWPPVLYAI